MPIMEKFVRIGIGELTRVRIACTKCGAAHELAVNQLHNFQLAPCPHCGQLFGHSAEFERLIAALKESLTKLGEMSCPTVEFIVVEPAQ